MQWRYVRGGATGISSPSTFCSGLDRTCMRTSTSEAAGAMHAAPRPPPRADRAVTTCDSLCGARARRRRGAGARRRRTPALGLALPLPARALLLSVLCRSGTRQDMQQATHVCDQRRPACAGSASAPARPRGPPDPGRRLDARRSSRVLAPLLINPQHMSVRACAPKAGSKHVDGWTIVAVRTAEG